MIETNRLILRPFNNNDLNDLYELLNQITVHCFMDMKVNSIEECKEALKSRMNEKNYFAIELKESNKVIGEIHAYKEESEAKEFIDTYSPCWMLNTAYQKKGYMYEAAYALFDYLFKNGARRLYAYTEDYNIASQNVCKKLGMRQEAFYKEFVSFVNDDNGNPIYENTLEFAILKKEWK